jgi:glyoxylase-like metal-dependent hydrolase (beta-lactamase superfamily II)
VSVHLVDCGYTGREGYAAAYLVPHADGLMVVETNTAHAVPTLLSAIDALGARPDDVSHIVITHVHLDHAGGASALMAACPHATLLAHPRAAPHAIDPSRLVASATAVYGAARFQELYGTIQPIPAERVRVLGDEERLTVGGHALRVLHTRGHANHHLCLVDEAESAVFTGDAFGIQYPAVPHLHFPSTTPTDFDAAAAIDSAQRIAACGATTAWLTHFGPMTGLQAAADALSRAIADYGAIVDEAGDRDGDALAAYCRARVAALFAGIDHPIVDLDRELNADGLVAAVQRRRRAAR